MTDTAALDALRPWLSHTSNCANRGYGPTCTCGLDAALRSLVPTEPDAPEGPTTLALALEHARQMADAPAATEVERLRAALERLVDAAGPFSAIDVSGNVLPIPNPNQWHILDEALEGAIAALDGGASLDVERLREGVAVIALAASGWRSSLSDIERWCRELLTDPEAFVAENGGLLRRAESRLSEPVEP